MNYSLLLIELVLLLNISINHSNKNIITKKQPNHRIRENHKPMKSFDKDLIKRIQSKKFKIYKLKFYFG